MSFVINTKGPPLAEVLHQNIAVKTTPVSIGAANKALRLPSRVRKRAPL